MRRAGSRAAAVLAPACVLVGLSAGCQPCQGTGLCVDPFVRYEGRVVRGERALPVAGAAVTLDRVGGIALKPSRLVALTDSAGLFRVEAEALAQGSAVVRLQVLTRPDATAPVLDTTGVRLHASRGRGDVRWLGTFRLTSASGS